MHDLNLPAAVTSCLPAAAYLLMVSTFLWATKAVPTWVHPIFLVAGLAFRVTVDGWADTGTSGGIALAVFFVLVLLAGGTVSGVTLFTLTVTLALTPFGGWPGVLGGLLVAAVVAAVRTWRHLGSGRVAWLAMDTMGAVGVSPTGALKKPDLSLIPERNVLTDVHDTSASADRLRMYLPPYLLVGVGLACVLLHFAG